MRDLPSRSPLLLALFRLYLRFLFWRNFSAVRLSRAGIPQTHAGRPLVIYCNHPSWWDPALMLLALPRLFPRRQGFGPMDARELARYRVLRHMGVFGIDLGHPNGAARFLRVATAVLRRPDGCLCVTAEGAFTDPRVRPVTLRPGLAHLARTRPDAVFLPMALEYVFWNESRPEALLRFGLPVAPPGGSGVGAWQAALTQGLSETMDALAAESAARDPASFRRVFRGTAGVGGVYDLWRRARALVTGQRFSARHEPEYNKTGPHA